MAFSPFGGPPGLASSGNGMPDSSSPGRLYLAPGDVYCNVGDYLNQPRGYDPSFEIPKVTHTSGHKVFLMLQRKKDWPPMRDVPASLLEARAFRVLDQNGETHIPATLPQVVRYVTNYFKDPMVFPTKAIKPANEKDLAAFVMAKEYDHILRLARALLRDLGGFEISQHMEFSQKLRPRMSLHRTFCDLVYVLQTSFHRDVKDPENLWYLPEQVQYNPKLLNSHLKAKVILFAVEFKKYNTNRSFPGQQPPEWSLNPESSGIPAGRKTEILFAQSLVYATNHHLDGLIVEDLSGPIMQRYIFDPLGQEGDLKIPMPISGTFSHLRGEDYPFVSVTAAQAAIFLFADNLCLAGKCKIPRSIPAFELGQLAGGPSLPRPAYISTLSPNPASSSFSAGFSFLGKQSLRQPLQRVDASPSTTGSLMDLLAPPLTSRPRKRARSNTNGTYPDASVPSVESNLSGTRYGSTLKVPSTLHRFPSTSSLRGAPFLSTGRSAPFYSSYDDAYMGNASMDDLGGPFSRARAPSISRSRSTSSLGGPTIRGNALSMSNPFDSPTLGFGTPAPTSSSYNRSRSPSVLEGGMSGWNSSAYDNPFHDPYPPEGMSSINGLAVRSRSPSLHRSQSSSYLSGQAVGSMSFNTSGPPFGPSFPPKVASGPSTGHFRPTVGSSGPILRPLDSMGSLGQGLPNITATGPKSSRSSRSASRANPDRSRTPNHMASMPALRSGAQGGLAGSSVSKATPTYTLPPLSPTGTASISARTLPPLPPMTDDEGNLIPTELWLLPNRPITRSQTRQAGNPGLSISLAPVPSSSLSFSATPSSTKTTKSRKVFKKIFTKDR